MERMFAQEIREGVELRILEERYAEQVFEAVDRNREHLREFLPWVDATAGPVNIKEFIRKSLHQFARNEGFTAGIWVDQRYAGTIGFLPIDWDHNKVEMGYWLGREFEGRGIVTAAARALITHAFREWKLNRVDIRCVTANVRSNRVAQRLGFQLDGTLRRAYQLYGAYHDLNVYGMLAQDWPKPL